MYKLSENGVIRLADGAFVPEETRNSDYQAYQAWLGAGNTPEPADEPSLAQARAAATARACAEIDRQMAASGLIPQSQFAAEMVSDIAFVVREWELAGEPETMPASVAGRVEAEAAVYGITPVQMITAWRQKWLEMRNGLSPILAQRRAWLLAIEAAGSVEEVEAVTGL